MLQAWTKRPDELTDAERAGWRALAASSPRFASPLLGPEFAELVGRVRRDVRVALFRREGAGEGELAGVLAHHRRPCGLARPVGAPWSDVHGLITAPGAVPEWRSALAAAGLRTYRGAFLADPHGVFADLPGAEQDDHVVAFVPGQSGEAYWEALRAGSPKRFKNIRRLEHKMERELGDLELRVDRSREAFDAVLGWKRRQFAQTGACDVLHPHWSRALMEQAFAARGPGLEGALITLRAGGRVAAAHFGLRAAGVMHPWIAAYDSALAAWSPGLVFMSMLVRAMPGLGLSRYELSTGSDHYKTVFASGSEPVRAVQAELRTGFSPDMPPLLMRVRSRLDHIAEADPTLGGRLHGFAQAVIAARRLTATPAALPREDA